MANGRKRIDPTLVEAVSERLAFVIHCSPMTPRELCSRFGVTQVTLNHWCSGEVIPSTAYLPDIDKTLNISLDFLFGLTEEPPEHLFYTDMEAGK